MKKFRLTIYLLVITLLLVTGALIGCTNTSAADGGATAIQVVETHVYLAPEGDPSTYVLQPTVFPLDTASQDVYYRLLDTKDREYLNVSSDGILQAKKLKTDEEGNNVDITVRVISVATPSIYVDVTVTIEIVEVERITFNPQTIIVEMQSPGVQLTPTFYPSHAITGRNVIYTSDDRNIASVNSSGFVTPRGIGKVAIWVKTPVTNGQAQISGVVYIDVRYSELNYRMDLTSSPSTLKQIVGQAEEISLVLNRLNSICDPSPSITWYVNTTTINETGVKDSKILNYTPSTLPAGEYYIRAVLSNNTQRKELISDLLLMYNPLDAINADIINENSTFAIGDIAKILVTFGSDKYPPESYRWTITRPDGKTESIDKARAEQNSSENIVGDLNYTFDMAGEYTFTAEAVVKGGVSGVKSSPITVTVGEAKDLSDIVNLYIDGIKTETGYAPTVNWDALPYVAEYSAEIRVGGESGTVYSLSSTADSTAFGANYVIIPEDIAGFGTSFEVRVKSEGYVWTDWLSYEEYTVTPDVYEYFDVLAGDYNAYIANMEELGRLLNYISVFRPEELLSPKAEDIFEFTLYIPFAYEDLPEGQYPMNENDIPAKDEVSYVNVYNIVVGAMRSYVESTAFSLGVPSAEVRGISTIDIRFNTDPEPTVTTELDPTVDEKYIYTDAEFAVSYGGTGAERELAVDTLTRELSVSTTNQLYIAVASGYKPVPVEGSSAERIYNKARQVIYDVTTSGMSATDKALNIYKWLSLNVVYDYKLSASDTSENLYANKSFYLEGVFDNGVAVCDGIAKAYAMLLRMDGIHAYKVCGSTIEGVGHAWNKMLIDSGWVGADVTWSNLSVALDKEEAGEVERLELLSYEYFGVTDEVLDSTRRTYGVYPDCGVNIGNYAYTVSISHEYDYKTDSDSELEYQVSECLKKHTDESGDVWIGLLLSSDYLEENGGAFGGAFDAINEKIQSYVEDGYQVATYREAYVIYIRLKRS